MSAHETLSQQIDVYVDPDRDATEQTSALNQVLLCT